MPNYNKYYGDMSAKDTFVLEDFHYALHKLDMNCEFKYFLRYWKESKYGRTN